MSLKKRLRTLVVCALLECGVLAGGPVRPEEIKELMERLNQPKIAHVLPAENDNGNDDR